MSTLIEIGIAIAAFVAILAARRRDWVTFAVSLLAVLIIAEGALAFLGQSVPPPIPTWDKLVAEGQQDLGSAWWISLLPAAMMFVTILSFNIMGDVVAKRFDIREGVA